MLRKSIIFLFIFPLIISSIYSQNTSESDTVIINSVNRKSHSGEIPVENVTFTEAKKWAYNTGLTLVPDSPPYVDNNAFFLTDYQTVVTVKGYKRELMYKIYIDFLKYRGKKLPFNSFLKFFIKDIYGNKRLAGTADLRYMYEGKIYEISVPFDLSYPGSFDIIIQEYSDKPGCWGIWDIIVSSKDLSEIKPVSVDSVEKIREVEEKIFK